MDVDSREAHENCKTYLIDLAAYIRSIVKQCKTVRDIAINLMRSIPDTYEDNSIKQSERNSRGEGERIFLRNPDMRLPNF